MVDFKPSIDISYRRPFYARTRFLFFALLLISIYSYGWRVTEIELGELVRDAHLVKPLIRDLLRPDLFTFETETESADSYFVLSGQQLPLGQIKKDVQGPVLTLSSDSGQIGNTLEVSGTGFRPNETGRIVWINSIEQEYPLGLFETDAGGNFHSDIIVPPIARGDVQKIRTILEWRTGRWWFSDTLRLTMAKMIETIFLALMATTFAVLIAVPMSFLGARNIMISHPTTAVIYYSVRTIFNVLRSVEPLIMAILFAVWGRDRSLCGCISVNGSLYCCIRKIIFRASGEYRPWSCRGYYSNRSNADASSCVCRGSTGIFSILGVEFLSLGYKCAYVDNNRVCGWWRDRIFTSTVD